MLRQRAGYARDWGVHHPDPPQCHQLPHGQAGKKYKHKFFLFFAEYSEAEQLKKRI